jgi:aspartate beta-hydroxylase
MAELLVRRGLLRVGPHRPLPSLFALPGLPQQPWWALAHLPPATQAAISALCASAPALLAEYEALERAAPQGDYAADSEHHAKLHTGAWTWHSAVQRGRLLPAFALAAPQAASLICAVPGLITGGVPFSYAFFSHLRAGAEIGAHCGPTNVRLRVHVPLRVPQGDVGLRVAGEARAWKVGEPLIFDDSFEHSAWNRSAGDRLVLLLDVWSPEVLVEERALIEGMFGKARKEGWLE